MHSPVETVREPDGRWVATMSQVPGLVVYGQTREDALVSARKLSAILLDAGDMLQGGRILAFYPGEIPESFRPEYSI